MKNRHFGVYFYANGLLQCWWEETWGWTGVTATVCLESTFYPSSTSGLWEAPEETHTGEAVTLSKQTATLQTHANYTQAELSRLEARAVVPAAVNMSGMEMGTAWLRLWLLWLLFICFVCCALNWASPLSLLKPRKLMNNFLCSDSLLFVSFLCKCAALTQLLLTLMCCFVSEVSQKFSGALTSLVHF